MFPLGGWGCNDTPYKSTTFADGFGEMESGEVHLKQEHMAPQQDVAFLRNGLGPDKRSLVVRGPSHHIKNSHRAQRIIIWRRGGLKIIHPEFLKTYKRFEFFGRLHVLT